MLFVLGDSSTERTGHGPQEMITKSRDSDSHGFLLSGFTLLCMSPDINLFPPMLFSARVSWAYQVYNFARMFRASRFQPIPKTPPKNQRSLRTICGTCLLAWMRSKRSRF